MPTNQYFPKLPLLYSAPRSPARERRTLPQPISIQLTILTVCAAVGGILVAVGRRYLNTEVAFEPSGRVSSPLRPLPRVWWVVVPWWQWFYQVTVVPKNSVISAPCISSDLVQVIKGPSSVETRRSSRRQHHQQQWKGWFNVCQIINCKLLLICPR